MSKPLITVLAAGSTGSIGRHAVRALLRDTGQAGQFPPAADVVIGDLTRAPGPCLSWFGYETRSDPSHQRGPERMTAGLCQRMQVPRQPMWVGRTR